VTVAPPEPWDAEPAQRPGLLADLGLGPVDILLVPLERQIAEKLHAYTRQYNGGTPRAKDLVDFTLIRKFERIDARRLKDTIQRTFTRRRTHQVPHRWPAPPPELAIAYRREARVLEITASLEEAHRLTAQWLDSVLACTARGTWDPRKGQWAEAVL